MKITILGSGTLRPDGQRNSSGYFVDLGPVKIMMDCGAGTLHALSRYSVDWERLTYIFLSHYHVDHLGELASLMQAFRHGMTIKRSEPLVLLGPPGLEGVVAGLEQAFGPRTFKPGFPVEIRTVTAADQVEIPDGGLLSFAKTPHNGESIAIRIESSGQYVCYTGDTAYSEDVADFFARTDIMISECGFAEPVAGSTHLCIDELSAMAGRAEAARLVVTHRYFEMDEEALMRRLARSYSGEIIIGKDGLTIEP